MDPDIAKPVSDVVYHKNPLTNGPNTEEVTPLKRCLVQLMSKTFGQAYFGSKRIGISLDGPEYASRAVPGGTSQFNPGEAEEVAWLCKHMLDYVPETTDEEPTRQVKPADIGISSPYAAQCAEIRRQLQRLAITGVTVQMLDITTGSQVQGREFEVHIVSWVKNNPGDPYDTGFITNPGQQCVLNSRARSFLISFGAYQLWCNNVANNIDQIAKKQMFYRFAKNFQETNQVIAKRDFLDGKAGLPVDTYHFQAVQLTGPQTMGQRGNRGGRSGAYSVVRGAGRGRGGPQQGGFNTPNQRAHGGWDKRGGRGRGNNNPRGGTTGQPIPKW
ncbi:hypothetical protein M409DRAFT_15918 [Zasmidium cellare ATCC 36951]|uniref:DNA2/NAM7 helicase-like C-terminal domain-containing protein n=1 Tax=Zasmidium cellare ATCC 36951 TaxID=1080233 RepID=A0A6A6D5J7_ZASCE|nr:uncharacterized protein M409DRAFT_15918 [Zasmidium cellare ATCC 36951]KAF2173640.1 hypothetical protein M409DRAFT_15918 [Zasmidium cellare ATCC 36951]